MDRLLYKVHEKSCSQLLSVTSSRSRRFLESVSLTLAVISFCTVILFHRSYVFHGHGSIPISCLQGVTSIQPLDSVDVTHIVISTGQQQNPTRSSSTLHSLKDGPWATTATCKSLDTTYTSTRSPYLILDDFYDEKDNHNNASDADADAAPEPTCLVQNLSQLDDTSVFLSFSPLEGYLLLPHSILHRLNITIQYITISKSDKRCFGDDKILRYALDYFFTSKTAEEVIALNWILGYQNHNTRTMKGYVKKYKTNQILDLSTFSREFRSTFLLHIPFGSKRSSSSTTRTTSSSSSSTFSTPLRSPMIQSYMKNDLFFKLGVLLSSLFLFFLTTTIVSFTLRTTQARMLRFTIQLQKHIRQGQHFSQLIIIHCIETMVFVPIILGIFFFLNDCFYHDKVLSFTIFSGIWVCEIFSALFMRTIPSSIYFPQVFFAYFTLFHVYYFSCPFGFTYAALFSITLLMVHSMIFFVNRFELPAFATGQVSRHVPRMAFFRNPSSSSIHPIQSQHPTLQNHHRGDHDMDTINNTTIHGPSRRPSGTHRMANGMSYPSMSSLGRITTSDGGFDVSDDL